MAHTHTCALADKNNISILHNFYFSSILFDEGLNAIWEIKNPLLIVQKYGFTEAVFSGLNVFFSTLG